VAGLGHRARWKLAVLKMQVVVGDKENKRPRLVIRALWLTRITWFVIPKAAWPRGAGAYCS
jgi:hypothetical protein